MAGVFISAGVYRIFFPAAAWQELIDLHMPTFLAWPIIILEIAGGLLLLIKKYKKTASAVLIIFLLLAVLQALIIQGRMIWSRAGELFVFNPNPTDIFLHLVFATLLLTFLVATVSKGSDNMPDDSQND